MRHARVIQLDPPPPDMSQLTEIREMLVRIYRDEYTDDLITEIHMGTFDFRLRASRKPSTRKEAQDMVRQFIDEIDYPGSVKWQMGRDGPIKNAPC